MQEIFVFGSNLGGRHGKGAALCALKFHGAIYGQANGLQGNSYAIPTKDGRLRTLDLTQIQEYVRRFIVYASICELHNKPYKFKVTAIGCGLAGYKPKQIAPFFRKALNLSNVELPIEFTDILTRSFKEIRREKYQNILDYIDQGLSQREIAKKLKISQATVCLMLKNGVD